MVVITIGSAAGSDICYVGGVFGRDEDVVNLINTTAGHFPSPLVYVLVLQACAFDDQVVHDC
jgi:hypothetical protein